MVIKTEKTMSTLCYLPMTDGIWGTSYNLTYPRWVNLVDYRTCGVSSVPTLWMWGCYSSPSPGPGSRKAEHSSWDTHTYTRQLKIGFNKNIEHIVVMKSRTQTHVLTSQHLLTCGHALLLSFHFPTLVPSQSCLIPLFPCLQTVS